jgi:hypothetical protein
MNYLKTFLSRLKFLKLEAKEADILAQDELKLTNI